MGVRDDELYMRRALRLAGRGLGRTSPNPPVGAVVVRRGKVVGQGFHRRAGLAHGEAAALKAAGAFARGATLYVTLEPCAHHGRTPPCVDAVLASGVREVVVGTRDPNPKVRGPNRTASRASATCTPGVKIAVNSRNRSCFMDAVILYLLAIEDLQIA